VFVENRGNAVKIRNQVSGHGCPSGALEGHPVLWCFTAADSEARELGRWWL